MTISLETKPAVRERWGLLTALVAVTWLAAGLVEFLVSAAVAGLKGHPLAWPKLLIGISGFWGLAALLTPGLVWALRRARRRPGRWRPVAGQAVVFLALVVVQPTLHTLWMNATLWRHPLSVRFLPLSIPAWIANDLGGTMLVYLGVLGAVLAWDYQRRYRERERAAAALELEQVRLRALVSEARLETLQMQLEPHFLFNTLHAISTLVLKGESRAADEMLSHLSRFLRLTLDRAESPTVPLADELDALDAYLSIQQVRFGDRLRVAMEVDAHVRAAGVPNLLFQPLVENSIRHGIAADPGAGTITVRARPEGDRLTLEVEDDGPGPPDGPAPREGIGLANVRERLERLYPDAHEFTLRHREGGGTIARVRIPLRSARPGPTSPTA